MSSPRPANFSGRVQDGMIASLVAQPDPGAVASGRLRVDASVFDLLRLRSLL